MQNLWAMIWAMSLKPNKRQNDLIDNFFLFQISLDLNKKNHVKHDFFWVFDGLNCF